MKIWTGNNKTNIMRGIKRFSLLALILLLCGCHDECDTVQDYINNGATYKSTYEGVTEDTYLMCALFNILIEIAKQVATKAWDTLARPLIPVVGVAAAIYVAIYTAKLVGTFGKQTATDYMTGEKRGLLMLMFKTAVIIFLLNGGKGPDWLEGLKDIAGALGVDEAAGVAGIVGENVGQKNFLIRSIITPILSSGLEIGGALALNGSMDFDFYSEVEGLLEETLGIHFRSPWGSLFEMVRGALKGFMAATYEPVAIGEAMICNASMDKFWNWYYLMLLYGFILFTFGWLMSVVVGFYLVDILINLTFAAILLPVGVACAISDKTMTFTKNIWNVFINVFFNFIILGIVIGMTLQVVDLCLSRGDEANTGGAMSDFLMNKQQQIDANQIKDLAEFLWSSGSLLLTIVCLSIMYGLIGQVGALAEKISGAGGISSAGSQTGAKITKPVINQAKRTAAKAYQRVGKPIATGTGTALSRITRLDKLSKWGGKVRGYFTGAGAQGYRAFWYKQGRRR